MYVYAYVYVYVYAHVYVQNVYVDLCMHASVHITEPPKCMVQVKDEATKLPALTELQKTKYTGMHDGRD